MNIDTSKILKLKGSKAAAEAKVGEPADRTRLEATDMSKGQRDQG